MAEGVTFAGNGGAELTVNNFKTVPSEPSMESSNEVQFVDNGGGDKCNSAFGTSQRGSVDSSSHDTNGGKGIEFIRDLR